MTKHTASTASTKTVAQKLILIAAAHYLTSCATKSDYELFLESQPQLDQLTDADRAKFEAWLNGPIAGGK